MVQAPIVVENGPTSLPHCGAPQTVGGCAPWLFVEMVMSRQGWGFRAGGSQRRCSLGCLDQ